MQGGRRSRWQRRSEQSTKIGFPATSHPPNRTSPTRLPPSHPATNPSTEDPGKTPAGAKSWAQQHPCSWTGCSLIPPILSALPLLSSIASVAGAMTTNSNVTQPSALFYPLASTTTRRNAVTITSNERTPPSMQTRDQQIRAHFASPPTTGTRTNKAAAPRRRRLQSGPARRQLRASRPNSTAPSS